MSVARGGSKCAGVLKSNCTLHILQLEGDYILTLMVSSSLAQVLASPLDQLAGPEARKSTHPTYTRSGQPM